MSEQYERQALLKGTSKAKQILYCVVLEPDTEDLQKDVIDAEEIEKTAHGYAIDSRVVGHAHDKDSRGNLVVADASIVETFIAPVDYEIDGEVIRKGSWVIAVKVNDAKLWQDIEAGVYDGVSIGGLGERIPM